MRPSPPSAGRTRATAASWEAGRRRGARAASRGACAERSTTRCAASTTCQAKRVSSADVAAACRAARHRRQQRAEHFGRGAQRVVEQLVDLVAAPPATRPASRPGRRPATQRQHHAAEAAADRRRAASRHEIRCAVTQAAHGLDRARGRACGAGSTRAPRARCSPARCRSRAPAAPAQPFDTMRPARNASASSTAHSRAVRSTRSPCTNAARAPQVDRRRAVRTQSPVGRAGAAPAHRAQARHQLLGRERLDEVVVGTAVEPVHAIVQAVACGQHQRGRGVAARTMRAQPVETRAVGQLPIDQPGVERLAAQRVRRHAGCGTNRRRDHRRAGSRAGLRRGCRRLRAAAIARHAFGCRRHGTTAAVPPASGRLQLCMTQSGGDESRFCRTR